MQSIELAQTGMQVLTTSGRRVGVVVAVREDALCMRPLHVGSAELWLESTAIFTVEAEGVTLICEEDGIHRYVVTPL